ncbi:MAG TPA: DUF2339 domain-containing protein [Pseudogracilibacillus sp.]|nr:DUF2339 domain-containing protein [Pseudogracilibacillus sp.]
MKPTLEKRVAYLEEKVKQLEAQVSQDREETLMQAENEKYHPVRSEGRSTESAAPSHQTGTAAGTGPDGGVAAGSQVGTGAHPKARTHTQHSKQAEQHAQATRQVAPGQRPSQKANPSEPIEWDVLIFQKIVPRVFIFILILGVVWGLKASYDYGIITIQVILAISFIFSIALAALGVWQIQHKRRVLGQVLIGGSIPIFMMTVLVMHQMYMMIGPATAMFLNIIAIAAGVVFTYIYRSESIGIISVVAGVFVPYLIESVVPNYYVFVAYEAILYLVFLSLALYLNVRALYFVATFFLHIAMLGLHLFSDVPSHLLVLTVMPIIFQQIALFVGLVLTKIKIQVQAHTVLVSLLLTSLWIGLLLDKADATTMFIGLTLMYAISFYFFQKDTVRAPIFLVNASLTLLFIFMVHDLDITYEILLITIMINIFYGLKFKALIHYIFAGFQYVIAFSFFSAFYIETWFSYEMLHKITFLILTIGALYFIEKRSSLKKLYEFGLPFIALLLMFFSNDITYLIAEQGNSFDSTPLILSAFWVLIAIGYMIYGKITSINIGKFIGIAILFFTVAKVILFDISFMSMTLRAILFIGLGLVGLIISRVYNKSK